MTPPMADATVSLAAVRAFWFQRQGLARPLGGPIDRVIAATGWLRSLGGADVYLAARARVPGMRRTDLEAAVAAGDLKVSMAVRGCIYLVPTVEVPGLLAEATAGWRQGAQRDLDKVGSSWKQIEKVAAAVLTALGDQALSTDAIRRALPAGAVPSFGDAGKKAGVSSPLPIALRWLELDGRIERAPEAGRLDRERYLWRVPQRPLPAAPTDPAVRRRRIAEVFLTYAGPASLDHLRCWAGWSQRDARAAIEGLDVATVSVTGVGDLLALRADVDAIGKAAATKGVVSVLSFEDNYLVSHKGPGLLTDPRHHGRKVESWGSSAPSTLGAAPHVASRTIFVDGMVAGFWEVDPARGAGVWETLDPQPAAVKDRIAAVVDDTTRFLLDDIGHACAFSLDTMDEVQKRASKIGKAAKPAKPVKPAASRKTARPAAAAAKKTKKR